MAASSGSGSSSSSPIVIEISKTEEITTTESITITDDIINKRIEEDLKEHLCITSPLPPIPFEYDGKLHHLSYHVEYDELHMYVPIKIIFGEKFAAEWLFKDHYGCNPTANISHIDYYLDMVSRAPYRHQLYGGYRVNPFEKFKEEHGGFQQIILMHLVNEKILSKKDLDEQVDRILSSVSFSGILMRLDRECKNLHETIKLQLKSKIEEEINNVLFPTTSSVSSSSSLSPSKRPRSS